MVAMQNILKIGLNRKRFRFLCRLESFAFDEALSDDELHLSI